jgi:hypothetical protein
MKPTHGRRWQLLAVFLFCGAGLVQAQVQPAAETPPPDPSAWLGLTPEAAYRDRGAPAEIYPLAVDDKRWQVVHFYGDHTYLFWSSNRVWQVRLDKLWTGTLKGIAMGAARADVEAAFGEPLAKGDAWSVWDLPYQTFPRRIRLLFTDGVLSDAYLYRSDL